ncbi:MAG: hypothetical protein V7638_1519 [Acidobacteriota bacterium]
MPKTAVHKNNLAVARENYVRLSWKSPFIKSKSETQ